MKIKGRYGEDWKSEVRKSKERFQKKQELKENKINKLNQKVLKDGTQLTFA